MCIYAVITVNTIMEYFKKKWFDFSMKNIPIPGEESYMKDLIHKTELFLTRLRWRVFFFLQRDKNEDDECDSSVGDKGKSDKNDDQESDSDVDEEERARMTYGFKSAIPPPFIKEIADFEKDLWKLIESTKFTEYRNPFQKMLHTELRNIKQWNELSEEVVTSPTLDIFKENMYQFFNSA